MERILLQDNETGELGIVLNDEDAITQDEHEITFRDDKKYLGINDKQLKEYVQEDYVQNGIDILHDEFRSENNLENTNVEEGKCEKSTTNLFNEDLNNKNDHEKTEEIIQPQSDGIFQNITSEKHKNTTVCLKTAADLKNHTQCRNETSNQNQFKDFRITERYNSEVYDEDTTCGIGFFKPRWLQTLATTKVYVILYSIMGILQGSYYTYLTGSLSTLEKKFAFKSKISGTIMTVDEITPLLAGMIVGYYASKAHRPRIVALGMLLSAGCCFVSTLPYFIYGSTKELSVNDIRSNVTTESCDANIQSVPCSPDRPQNLISVLLFILGSFLKGFGNLAFYVVGLAYLDDNSIKRNTPIYLAISLALRLLGPLLGFLMSSGFLKYYENPLYDPGFGPDDPRWIGAWWIGFFLQGILLVIFTIPIALFPRRLPGQKKVEKVEALPEENGMKKIFTGLISALKRLGKNPVFIVLIINTNMKVFGHFGHAIMLPKYMENQFRLSASEASLYSGAVSILCIIISTILGGFLIWKYRPQIKALLLGMIVSEIILCIGFLILMIPRCQTSEMLHFGIDEDGLILNSVCNRNCDCSTSAFTPFCGPDDKTLYFSPCYAGCTLEMNSSLSSKTNKEFGNCSCVDQLQVGATISEGFCPDENCRGQMIAYLIILFIMVTVSNLFTVAATMILLRSVHPSDKSIALGTFETFICLFGFIPFPVTFGALVDSACLVWEKSCGETGNCWFYDMDKYNYLLHGVSSLFSSFSVVCLIILYFLSHRVRNLYVEEEEELRQEESKYVDIKLDTVSGSVTKL